jgi:CheY-like chemotaxis protein
MSKNKEGKQIVWIDDDTDIIDPVVRPLELAGYVFHRLHTVAEALSADALERMRRADLVLLDMILPPGPIERAFSPYPGKDILHELRRVQGITTPVIVLTVVTNEEVLRQVEALGVADIVRKPARPSYLKEAVERVLEKRDA